MSLVSDTLWGLVEPLKRSTLLPRPTTAAAVHAVAGSRIIYTACYTRSAGTNAKCVTAAYLHLSLSCAQRVPAVSLPLCVKESGLCYQVSQRSTDLNLGPNKMQRVKATFTFLINRRVVTLYHRLHAWHMGESLHFDDASADFRLIEGSMMTSGTQLTF